MGTSDLGDISSLTSPFPVSQGLGGCVLSQFFIGSASSTYNSDLSRLEQEPVALVFLKLKFAIDRGGMATLSECLLAVSFQRLSWKSGGRNPGIPAYLPAPHGLAQAASSVRLWSSPVPIPCIKGPMVGFTF